jgi:hypothetical protein
MTSGHITNIHMSFGRYPVIFFSISLNIGLTSTFLRQTSRYSVQRFLFRIRPVVTSTAEVLEAQLYHFHVRVLNKTSHKCQNIYQNTSRPRLFRD